MKLIALILLCTGMAMAQHPDNRLERPNMDQRKTTGRFADATTENHGVTLTWTASTSAATCIAPTCVGTYQVFEGATGQESAPALYNGPLLTFTDDGATMNAYSGTTRCYNVRFQEVSAGVTSVSFSSNEACFPFPAAPPPVIVPPGTPTGTIH